MNAHPIDATNAMAPVCKRRGPDLKIVVSGSVAIERPGTTGRSHDLLARRAAALCRAKTRSTGLELGISLLRT